MHSKYFEDYRTNPNDFGPNPFVIDLYTETMHNFNYRTALWTGAHLQLTLMSIPAGDEIGLEVHNATDQFLRIEEGCGLVKMGPSKDSLDYQHAVCDGYAVFVPAGTWHNIINTGARPLNIYAIYSPPEHPHGTVERTKSNVDISEGHGF